MLSAKEFISNWLYFTNSSSPNNILAIRQKSFNMTTLRSVCRLYTQNLGYIYLIFTKQRMSKAIWNTYIQNPAKDYLTLTKLLSSCRISVKVFFLQKTECQNKFLVDEFTEQDPHERVIRCGRINSCPMPLNLPMEHLSYIRYCGFTCSEKALVPKEISANNDNAV